MKLGIISSPTSEGIRRAAEQGLEFVEFCINVRQDVDAFERSVPELAEACRATGVAVGSIGRWGSDRITADGVNEEELAVTRRLIDAAAALGCGVFVCGINYVEGISLYDNYRHAISFLEQTIVYASERGIRVAVYNCRWNNFIVGDEQWRVVLGHLPELGIKYDPSHAIYAGADYLREMRDWGERFYHVHIKGSVRIGGERFDDPPAGLDQTDWGSFMSVLYAKKYAGGLSIEPHSATWKGELGDRGVQFTIEFMNRLLFRK